VTEPDGGPEWTTALLTVHHWLTGLRPSPTRHVGG
jgi:hypothetical protein